MNTPPQPRTTTASESAHTHDSASDPEATLGVPNTNGDDALQRIGDFTILGILGEGGMGTVYRAEDRRLDRKAAIKTMKPELAAKRENRERFVREAKAAAAVEHDNIVPIWQIGDAADGSLFIAMPLLQGEMLDDRLNLRGTKVTAAKVAAFKKALPECKIEWSAAVEAK